MAADLDIAWSLDEPPVAPAGWRPWETVPPPAPADAALESRLAWPQGTLAVLRQAFAAKLGRRLAWESPSPAVAAAARIYKRGVAHRAAPNAPFAAAPRAGQYQVRVHPTCEIPTAGFTVVDANVARLWPSLLWPTKRCELALDEHAKTLDAVATILEAARQAGSPPRWAIVAGGLLSDVAAFAAGLAGAEFTLVPTTLLAMADACVGGKTGVNFPPYGKNQLGLFRFPRAVQVWSGWLSTLPPRELRAGGAECLKHAFLAGDLDLADALATALAKCDLNALTAHLATVIAVKAKVVAADPGETGQRATLNLGHTLGHALEGVSQRLTTGETTLLHGEAVGVGLAFALKLSRRTAGLARDVEARMTEQLRRAGCLPTGAVLRQRLGVQDLRDPALFAELCALMGHDKKNTGAATQWVLLAEAGRCARSPEGDWTTPAPVPDVEAAWAELALELG